jgi:hypothetical protein
MHYFLDDSPPTTEAIENALIDFGFYHRFPDVSRMYAEYINNKQYGYPGGVLDQPEEYWHDMNIMNWLKLWVKHVSTAPRLEPVSVFDTLAKEGRFGGRWIGGGDASE